MSAHLPPAISIRLFRLNMPWRGWEGTQLQGGQGELGTESSEGDLGWESGEPGLKGCREQGCSLPHTA